MSFAASRKSGGGASGTEQERLVNDRAQYIAFLEQQLERVSAACQNVQFMDEKLDHLKQTQNTYEAKISNLAKLVKLDKQHTAKIKSDTNEFAETLKQRILFLESQSRAQFDKLEDHMTRLDTMYSAFPADAAAISQIGGAQPQGLPGFIATYIHSLFTQHTQSTAASLTQQAQTHQIHLQNWVQEYIKSTHPSSKLLDEVNSFKLELHTMNAKQSDSESRLISLVEKRMSGYTEIYTTMEERFLSVVDTHHRKITDQVQAYEARMEDMQRVLEENVSMATTTANESSQLRSDVDAQRGSTQEFLQLLEEMKSKLDAGLVDFNAHINALVLELREKTWHAEQTCSRLAVDTISRQNAFSKKLEQQIGEQQTALQQEMQTHIQRAGEAATELRSNVAAFEKRMEKLSKKTDNRIQILANTLKDRFDEDAPVHPSPTSAQLQQKQFDHLDALSREVDTKLSSLRAEVAASERALALQLEQHTDESIAAACRELHLRVDKDIEDKLYLIERADKAHALARKSEQLAAGAAALAAVADDASASAAPKDIRALKNELNTELKRNVAAMHALLEEKIKLVERSTSAASTLEHSRTLGLSLRELEDKSRAADEFLSKAQELYHTLQQQVADNAGAAAHQQSQQYQPQQAQSLPASLSVPSAQSKSAPTTARPSTSNFDQPIRHRPASPTIYAPNAVARPPVAAPSASASAPAARLSSRDDVEAKYPSTFANTLPYYHDPKDPHSTFMAHTHGAEGSYVPPARPGHLGPSSVQRPPTAADLRDEVVRQAGVRKAADAALDRALSPLRHRSRSPPGGSPSLLRRLSPGRAGIAAIHHHTTDDLAVNRVTSKPYALIPTHFPPPAAAPSFFDAQGRGVAAAAASDGLGSGGLRGLGGGGVAGAARSLDDSDLVVNERALASGLGNIDQLLRSMEYMDSVEGGGKSRRAAAAAASAANTQQPASATAFQAKGRGTSARGGGNVSMKRTGGGFVAPNLLQQQQQPSSSTTAASTARSAASSSSAAIRGKSPYAESDEEDVFLKPRRSTGRQSTAAAAQRH